jgi:chorismate synthase
VRIRSGLLDGRTTGAPVLMEIANEDKRSRDYAGLRDTPRPGHSDYPARVRYHERNDPRGGGMFSGRLTACWVMAGALAAKVLSAHGVASAAHAVRVGGVGTREELDVASIRRHVEATPARCAVPAVAADMIAEIEAARKQGDSVGGVVECVVEGVPAGVGDPLLDSVESMIAHALFGVPAVKGVEFGDGFRFADQRGSEVVDAYALGDAGEVVTRANHNGGVLGGIATGMPIRFRVAFKPTSSIPKSQRTLDLATRQEADLQVKGRHDPCIVPRAVPVVEAVASCVLLDLMLERFGHEGVARPFTEARS